MDGNLCVPGTTWAGSLDVVDATKETNFMLNITSTPDIVADEHAGWNHSINNEEVGYICEEQKGITSIFIF